MLVSLIRTIRLVTIGDVPVYGSDHHQKHIHSILCTVVPYNIHKENEILNQNFSALRKFKVCPTPNFFGIFYFSILFIFNYFLLYF